MAKFADDVLENAKRSLAQVAGGYTNPISPMDEEDITAMTTHPRSSKRPLLFRTPGQFGDERKAHIAQDLV